MILHTHAFVELPTPAYVQGQGNEDRVDVQQIVVDMEEICSSA